MKRAILMVITACSAAMLTLDADARRMGGGRTMGAPRDVATQKQVTPPTQNAAPATPATPAAAAAKGPVNTPPPVAQPGWKRFIGPIAGIAAGLGIAALMSRMGLSEGFGNFLVMLLMVIAVVMVVRMILRRRPAQNSQQGLQYAGAQAGQSSPMSGPVSGPMSGGGSASGNFGGGQTAFGGASGSSMAAGAVAAATPVAQPYPPGFDPEPFLEESKKNFVRLQASFDQGDVETLRDVLTPEMFAEISRDIAARGTQQQTDIVRLNAEILEVVTDSAQHWATVRFHGLTREDGIETPQPFDEAWNLRKAVDGSTGWLLAGIQQLQ